MKCLGIGFLTRPQRERDDPIEGEMKMAETALTENDKAKLPDEPFIIWKVRVANRVFLIANQIHNAPDKGLTQWRYDSWRQETHLTRTQNFMAFIVRLRTLPPEERPPNMDVSKVVGCSVCNLVFENMECLEAHVDRKRFLGHSLHANAETITDTTHERVRDTAPDFKLPMPTLDPSGYLCDPPRERERDGEALDRVYREEEEDDEQYRDRLQDYVRSEYRNSHEPDAVGCAYCGRIFRNGFDYFGHAASFHNFDDESARENLVK